MTAIPEQGVSLLPALENRRSIYTFDPKRQVESSDLKAIFDAARWAMSAFNEQPWRYIVGVRENNDGVWARIRGQLSEGNQPWTQNVPVLALGLIKTNYSHNDKTNRTASHDLGAASAMLTVEAVSRGLAVHQMAGVSLSGVQEEFNLDPSLQPVTAIAIGYPGVPSDVADEYAHRDTRPRERMSMDEIVIEGSVSILQSRD